jgi:hypothetical protein
VVTVSAAPAATASSPAAPVIRRRRCRSTWLRCLARSSSTDNAASNGKAVYSMSKAANADDMLLTSAGLWIASTNRFGVDVCNHVSGHAGICFLPYS